MPINRQISQNGSQADIEAGGDSYFYNHSITSFTWDRCNVTVKDRTTKNDRKLLDNVSGVARAGEMLALMGPSGSGKTTLLNLLADRIVAKGATVESNMLIDGSKVDKKTFRSLSSYVEQEDALIGSLTVAETLHFAARMSSSSLSSKKKRQRLVNDLLSSFGLTASAGTIVGTPVQKGISGGQKRRLSSAVGLISAPKILFLDEPTSGLDSTSSKEVMSFIKTITQRFKLIVICSIHQPSTATFDLFDNLLLLSGGKVCYSGQVNKVKPYFDQRGFVMPAQINPAEFILDLVNTDFSTDEDPEAGHERPENAKDRLWRIHQDWANSDESKALMNDIGAVNKAKEGEKTLQVDSLNSVKPNFASMLLTLLHRAFIKSYRDIVAYWVRVVMYMGLSILMGTVWLRLDANQESIQPFINSIFFGAAFLSFMAVAYVPAYLEDIAVFSKDRANGLYGPALFMLQNFLIGIPYLFLITILFTVITYWLTNFRHGAGAVFTFIMWVFLDLLAAESLVVFLSSIIPNFVVSLALVAFANGLWMAVGGFLVPLPLLNVFYKYVFHYIDYQAYVFQGMMVNEFKDRTYSCASDCQCSYPTGDLTCAIPGTSVLNQYSYKIGKEGQWVGILIAIIVVYRFLGYAVVWMKRH